MPFTPSERSELALEDIRRNVGYILDLRTRHTRETLFNSWESSHAAVRCLEIISEASRRLTPETLARYDLPWRRIMDAGNIYRHGYDALDPNLVWLVLTRDIDALALALNSAP